MPLSPRTAAVWLAFAALAVQAAASEVPTDNKKLGTIFNSDINGLLICVDIGDQTAAEYRQLVDQMLSMRMNVLAQNVGMPDPVIYRSRAATTWDKYHEGTVFSLWPQYGRDWARWQSGVIRSMFASGTDPLQITIEECRKRGTLCVASYRMNAQDFYDRELDLQDFGRKHRGWAIPGACCLDPAIPGVYKHRMAIFREVLNNCDVDGIELDFLRTHNMVSDPLKNYTVLTQMVRDVRRLLDASAKSKGRNKLLLGVRVMPILGGEFRKEDFPGASYGPPTNTSCKDKGLDVATWIKERIVDYVCPSLFEPASVPRTREFADLAKGTNVGIYPTIFSQPGWVEGVWPGDEKNPILDSPEVRQRHRSEVCKWALQCYADGADGISTYNWPRCGPDGRPGIMWHMEKDQTMTPHDATKRSDYPYYIGASHGCFEVCRDICRRLASPDSLRRCAQP